MKVIEEKILLLSQSQNKADQKALEIETRLMLIKLPEPNQRLQQQFRNASRLLELLLFLPFSSLMSNLI